MPEHRVDDFVVRVGEAPAGPGAASAWDGFEGETSAAATTLRVLQRRRAAAGHTAQAGASRIVFEGTLYNRAELSDDARASDAAVVLEAYLRSGEGFLARLRGAFAFVIWDDRNQELVAARDPVGTYPLFFTEVAGAYLFSPSLDDLVAQPGVSSELNRLAIADHLCGRWPDPGETHYERVRRVPPGRAMRARNGTRTEFRYWNPAPPDRPLEWIEHDELDRFEELFAQAVERALRPGPAGIFLSGGLDSVSVAAMAADVARQEGRRDPLALSIVFPTDAANEEDVQRGVAAGLGLEHVVTPFYKAVGAPQLLQASLDTSASWPSPHGNIWHPAYRGLIHEAVDHGCRVILTGAGGDEWLTVGPFLAADLIRARDVRGLIRFWRELNRSMQLARLGSLRALLWTFGTRPILASVGERYLPSALNAYRRRRQRELTPEWLVPDPELRRALLDRAYAWTSRRRPGQSYYDREGQLSLEHTLVSTEMEDLFEGSRRYGIDFRMPYWDADLVDFLYRVPPQVLNEGGRSKGLVRRMLERRFPELGFERQKKVLATNFFGDVLTVEGPRLWQEMGGMQALEKIGIVDKNGVNSVTEDAFRSKEARAVSLVWYLMTMESWVRSRLESSGRR